MPTSSVGRRAADLLAGGGGVLVLPPAISPIDAIVAATHRGRALVVIPTVARAEAMAAALARRGLRVAVVPRQWALAAAGVDVVIGARGAAWAPCPGLGVAVVVDEHDESLQEERSPTWHARDVVIERVQTCRRTGVAHDAVPDRRRCRRCWRPAGRPPGRRSAGRLADRRHRRPQRRGAVANVVAVVGVDPAAAQ